MSSSILDTPITQLYTIWSTSFFVSPIDTLGTILNTTFITSFPMTTFSVVEQASVPPTAVVGPPVSVGPGSASVVSGSSTLIQRLTQSSLGQHSFITNITSLTTIAPSSSTVKAAPSATPTTIEGSINNGESEGTIIAIVIPTVFSLVVLLTVVMLWLRRRRRRREVAPAIPEPGMRQTKPLSPGDGDLSPRLHSPPYSPTSTFTTSTSGHQRQDSGDRSTVDTYFAMEPSRKQHSPGMNDRDDADAPAYDGCRPIIELG